MILKVRWCDPNRPFGEWISTEIISEESRRTMETVRCVFSEYEILMATRG